MPLIDLPECFELNRPATSEAIAVVEAELQVSLPPDLRRLLEVADGWAGDRVLFYGTECMVERSSAWETSLYAPAHLAIADDGGGRVALISKSGSSAVFVSDCGDMSPDYFEQVAATLEGWVAEGCPFELPEALAKGEPGHAD